MHVAVLFGKTKLVELLLAHKADVEFRDERIALLERPGALTAGLNWYRANVPPESWIAEPPELPPIELISHVSPSPLNPLGVKGVGECGVIPAAAAIISAIEHALDVFGIRIVETPVSPARIVELVNSGSSVPAKAS